MSMSPLAVTAADPPVWLAVLMRVHDQLTRVGVQLAMLGLALVVCAYVFEVVLRYGFNSPTQWSADLVSYLLLFITFMAMPQVTANGGHVAVTALLERVSSSAQRASARAIAIGGVVVCLLLTWICLQETLRQMSGNVQMMAAYPVPKAWISIWIVYGMGSSVLYFLRMAIWPPSASPGASS
jgi:C4-dicarboxylate transporter, DctQ subunit